MFANEHTATLLDEIRKAPHSEHWIEELRDGTHVLIRPLCAEDHCRLLKFFRQLSPLSLRFRFLGAITHVDDSIIDKLMTVTDGQSRGYVALIHHNGTLQIIAISRYTRSDHQSECACMVAVADAWQRMGLGSLLMSHLITAARNHGIRKMTSTDLSTDYPVHRLYKRLGFTSAYLSPGYDCLVHDLEL